MPVRLQVFWLLARIKIMDKLKLVKIIVCLLTFTLVFGALLLFGTIYKRIKGDDTPIKAAEIILGEPKGSNIASMIAADGMVYVLVKDGGKDDRIIVISPAKAQKTAEIKLYQE